MARQRHGGRPAVAGRARLGARPERPARSHPARRTAPPAAPPDRGEPAGLAIAGTELAGPAQPLPELDGVRSFILDLVVDQREEWSLWLGRPDGAHVTLAFERGALTVDRSTTRYPHGDLRRLAVPDLDRLEVTVVHDRSVTEVFVAGGHTAFSLRSYLDTDDFQVALAGDADVLAAAATVLE